MSVITDVATNMSRARSVAGEYLTFVLGTEEYGLEILKVQELILSSS